MISNREAEIYEKLYKDIHAITLEYENDYEGDKDGILMEEVYAYYVRARAALRRARFEADKKVVEYDEENFKPQPFMYQSNAPAALTRQDVLREVEEGRRGKTKQK